MNTTRRGFMQQSAALGASTAAPWLASLAAIGEASAQTLPNDYKALVCVFLFGGNDHANTMIPVDIPANQLTKPLADNVLKPGYDNYIKYRREIAYQWADNKLGVNPPGLDPVPSVDLIPDTKRSSVPGALSMDVVKNLVVSGTNLPAGRNFAFSPPLTEMKQQFDAGKLAVLLNVGPLVEPTIGYRSPVDGTFYYLGCKADGTADATFNTNGSVSTARQALLPPRLGSHNDQQLVWQAFKPEGAANGWGGKIADQMGGLAGQPRVLVHQRGWQQRLPDGRSHLALPGHGIEHDVGAAGQLAHFRVWVGRKRQRAGSDHHGSGPGHHQSVTP